MPKTIVRTGKADVKNFPLKPLLDRVVVRPDEKAVKSRGGVLLPDQAKEQPSKGTVVAVGPGRELPDGTRAAMQVKAGDRVLFGRWQGRDVEVDGEDFLIVSEGDIHLVIEGEGG